MLKKNSAKKQQLNLLQPGIKVQVSLEDYQLYPTLLEDITPEGCLLIAPPTSQGEPVPLFLTQQLTLFFLRRGRRFCLTAQVESMPEPGGLPLVRLSQLSAPKKYERRNSFRLPIHLPAAIRLFGDGAFPPSPAAYLEENSAPWENCNTNDISETGLSLDSHHPYDKGHCVQLRIDLCERSQNEQIELLGIVRQAASSPSETAHFRLGIEFLPYEETLRRRVSKFILLQQQRSLKMRSLNCDQG